MRAKESYRMGVNAPIWVLKTQKLLWPLSRPFTLTTNKPLHSCDSTSLLRQLLASEDAARQNPGSALASEQLTKKTWATVTPSGTLMTQFAASYVEKTNVRGVLWGAATRLPRINISECLKRKFYQDQMSDNNIIEETWDKQNSLNLLRNIIAQVQKLNWITNWILLVLTRKEEQKKYKRQEIDLHFYFGYKK